VATLRAGELLDEGALDVRADPFASCPAAPV
jgi:hypothetical protein